MKIDAMNAADKNKACVVEGKRRGKVVVSNVASDLSLSHSWTLELGYWQESRQQLEHISTTGPYSIIICGDPEPR